jgi:signal transduction histidine kinase
MNIYAYASLSASTIILFLGLFVLANNSRNSINKMFALSSTIIAGWIFCCFLESIILDKPTIEAIDKVLNMFAVFSPSLFAHTIYTIVGEKDRKGILLSYSISVLLLLSIFTPFFSQGVVYRYSVRYLTEPGLLYFGFILLLILCGYLSLAATIKAYRVQVGYKREQLRYLFVAIGVIVVAALSYFMLVFNIKIPPLDNYLNVVYGVIMTYAIVRHRLMDIEIIIKKGIIYSILMATIVGIYSFLIFISQNIFQSTLGINQWLAAILTAFAIAIGYKPLETVVTDLTNQYFFKKKYDYQKTLKDSSEAMNLLTDIDRLIRLTTRIVARRMELEEASTLIFDESHRKYIIKAAEGKSKELLGETFSDNFELFKQLYNRNQILIKDEVVNTLNSILLMPDERKRLNTIKKEMEKLHAQICVPSITRGKYMGNKLVAVFCLGEKKSGDIYSNEDIQLLSTLSNQAAVAVENAIMYSDLMKQFQELKETKDQLVQSEKLAALGTMAAGIAHEIKNPLTSLQLFSQMMAERFDDHEFREKFTQIVPPEIERLNKIVNELVSFAKPSKLIMEPAQVNDILDKTIRLSEISFKKLNVKVIKEFGPVPAVMCDQQKLMQIFLNLIMNGSQSMATGGTLTVRTYFDDINKNVCIDIKDTGHGITEENLKKIFAPFFTTKEGGTGLGLAITKRIVEEHKGNIKIKSAVGEGTTFTVELPVAV